MTEADPPQTPEPGTGEAHAPPRPVTVTDLFSAALEPASPQPGTPGSEAAAAEPPPPPPAAPPPQPPAAEPLAGPRRADANAEIVTYEEIRDTCWAAHRRRQAIVAVLGLPASGKSFFIQRLRQSLSQTHVHSAFRGEPASWNDRIDRTRQILLSSLRPTVKLDSRDAIHLFDVPGDFIAPLIRGGFRQEADIDARLGAILMVLSLADALVFVAPALQVLDRRLYIAQGDDEALTGTSSLDEAQRIDRVADLERFISSLQYLRGLLQPLRETLAEAERRAGRKGPAVDPKSVLDQAIQTALATPFERRQARIDRPVRLPLLMLLSRADELKRRGGASVTDDFDVDPAWQVVQCHSEYFDHLSGFESYCIDFLTAQPGENPQMVNPDVKGFGADGLLRRWLRPAVADSRRPAWLNALRSPRTATRLRRWLDPDFPKVR
jgi:hypothetical protein